MTTDDKLELSEGAVAKAVASASIWDNAVLQVLDIHAVLSYPSSSSDAVRYSARISDGTHWYRCMLPVDAADAVTSGKLYVYSVVCLSGGSVLRVGPHVLLEAGFVEVLRRPQSFVCHRLPVEYIPPDLRAAALPPVSLPSVFASWLAKQTVSAERRRYSGRSFWLRVSKLRALARADASDSVDDTGNKLRFRLQLADASGHVEALLLPPLNPLVLHGRIHRGCLIHVVDFDLVSVPSGGAAVAAAAAASRVVLAVRAIQWLADQPLADAAAAVSHTRSAATRSPRHVSSSDNGNDVAVSQGGEAGKRNSQFLDSSGSDRENQDPDGGSSTPVKKRLVGSNGGSPQRPSPINVSRPRGSRPPISPAVSAIRRRRARYTGVSTPPPAARSLVLRMEDPPSGWLASPASACSELAVSASSDSDTAPVTEAGTSAQLAVRCNPATADDLAQVKQELCALRADLSEFLREQKQLKQQQQRDLSWREPLLTPQGMFLHLAMLMLGAAMARMFA